jgi:hypothetical protein
MKYKFIAATAIVLSAYALAGSHSDFKKLNFPNGISIEIPYDWKILTGNEMALIAAAAGSSAQNDSKTRLLAANTNTNPPTAIARLSRLPLEDGFSQAELDKLGFGFHDPLTQLSDATEESLKKQDIKIVHFDGISVGNWGNDRALVISYTRLSASGGEMSVKQYKIPTSNFIIELTLSYRESEAEKLRPIITYIRDSLKY